MSDWKRFAVWIGIVAWCFFSIAFDVRAQELSPTPEFTEHRCGEPVVAANTIIIKKKAVVSAAAGGGAGTSYYTFGLTANDFPTEDTEDNSGYDIGGPITVTTPGNVTKLLVKIDDNGSAINVRICLYADDYSTNVASCTFVTPGDSVVRWSECDVDPPVAVSGAYRISFNTSAGLYFYKNTGAYTGWYEERLYVNGCDPDGFTPSTSANWGIALGMEVE